MNHLLPYIKKTLESHFPPAELKSLTKIICCDLLEISELDFYVRKDIHLSENKQKELETILHRLINHEPIQYIVGHTPFCGHSFEVNQHVLIPRPETEELVEWIAETIPAHRSFSVLDIGTGSGCIAISLKNIFTNAIVSAYDVSEAALTVAGQNAKLNNLPVIFEKYDILNQDTASKKWDLIVSNPPYIPENEKIGILPNVLDNEPHLALFVPDNDPLIFYRKIAQFAQKHLSVGGLLFFEIHRDFGKQTLNLLNELCFADVELRRDLSGNDRMIKARKC